MKTKLYAKKTLSVFMAIMMLMSAWVFVAPTEVSASGDNNASALASANLAILNTLTKPAEVTLTGNLSTKVGRYNFYSNGDTDTVVNKYGTSSFINVVYTPQVTSANDPAADFGMGQSQRADSVKVFYPDTVMVVDGKSIPQMGVMLAADAYKNQSLRCISCWMSSGSNGLSFMSRDNRSEWYGKAEEDSCFYYTMWDAPNGYCVSSDGQNTDIKWGTSSGKWTFFANHLRFTGSFNANEWVRQIKPTWSFMGGSNDSSVYTASTTRKTIYVVNLKGYNDKITEIFNTLQSVKNNAAKYTTASVQTYVNAIQGVINASPANYNFNNDGGSAATSWNSAITNAISTYDTEYKGLKTATYTLKFVAKDGTVKHSQDYAYGTSVNLAGIANGISNTLEKGNENGHQTYTWGNLATSHVVTDDMIINETPSGIADHTYGDYTQTDKEHSRTCSVCGYVQTQNHTKNAGHVTKEETCTKDGVMTYDCAVCGKQAIATSVINNISGHDFTGTAYEKETGENGNHWKKCSRCGAYGWSSTENAYEKHDWDKNGDGQVNASDAVTVASTCYSQGSETYTCKVCKATWTKTLELADHKITATAKKDVTNLCGGDGNKAFWTCSVCNRVWKDAELTDELTDKTDADNDGIPDALETKGPDHNFTGAYVSKTPGKDGTHYRQCERFAQCNTYGPEEKHTWGDPAVTEATCEKTGMRVYTCTSGCGQTYEETIDKVAHSMTKHDAVEAKCGVAGSIEYYSCSICGKNYSDANGTTVVTNTVVPALEHKWTAHHEYDELKTPATCQAAAVYYNYCDYCKTKLVGAEHSYGEKDTVNGHNFNGAIVKNADGSHSYKCTVDGCTEAGAKTTCAYTLVVKDEPSTCHTLGYTITKCEICGNEKTDIKTDYDFKKHDGGTEVRFETEAKCNTDGYTGDTFCLGCNTKIKQGTSITADPSVHPHENMKDYGKVDSTCQKEGTKAYRYCDQCGTYEIAKETIAKKAHKFTTYTSNGNGTHTAVCDTCDAAVATPVTDTQNCTGGTANCQSGAICSVCNTAYGEKDENTHVNKEFVAKVPATCQKKGTEAYYKCKDCGNAIGEIEEIEVNPHSYGTWTKVEGEDKHTRSCTTCVDTEELDIATETEDCSGGTANCIEKAKCTVCKNEYGSKNPAVHKTTANTLDGAYEATCQKEGFSGNYLYDCCKAVKEAGHTIEKKAHKFDIEISRTDATCIAKGEVTYKCSTCVESEGVTAATQKKELAIDAKNHATPDETVTIGKKDATCEEDGHTGDVYYKCCYSDAEGADNRKALKEKGTTIKANGQHVFGDAVPEYMISITEKDGVSILGEKATEPDYAAKVAARHLDNKWYHAQQCTICGVIAYGACYTYAHTYSCSDTDKCEVCKGLCSLKDENKHVNLVEIPKVDATHTEDGTKAYYKCTDCGKFFLDEAGKKSFDPESAEGKALITISKDTVPCTEWEKTPFETKEPTCGQDGYKKYHCTVAGCDKVKTEVIPATAGAHTWSEDYKVVKEPTCGAVGYEAIYCTVCGATKSNSTVTIAATGNHSFKLIDTDNGTSCLDPTVKTYKCEVCGKGKTETIYDGDAEHKWGEWINRGGNCASGVLLERTCTVAGCGAKEQKKVENNDHEWEVIVRVEPNCEEDGYEISRCKNCKLENKVEIKLEGDASQGHVINEEKYKTLEKATCEAAEQREYVCLICGEKVVKSFGEPIEHVWLLQPAEIATCTKEGHREYYRCVRCEKPYDDGKGEIVIKKLDHEDLDGDGKCDGCNGKLYEGGDSNCGCMCHKEGWLMQLLYKIVSFFWKLFKINPSCACGATHY